MSMAKIFEETRTVGTFTERRIRYDELVEVTIAVSGQVEARYDLQQRVLVVDVSCKCDGLNLRGFGVTPQRTLETVDDRAAATRRAIAIADAWYQYVAGLIPPNDTRSEALIRSERLAAGSDF